MTIVAALWRQLDRETAAYFSFIINASHCRSHYFAICRRFSRKAESISSTSLIVGTLSAAFFGYIAVSWMIQYLKRQSLKVFAYYVWGLGILILMLQFTDVFLSIMIKKLISLRSCFIHTRQDLFIKGKNMFNTLSLLVEVWQESLQQKHYQLL